MDNNSLRKQVDRVLKDLNDVHLLSKASDVISELVIEIEELENRLNESQEKITELQEKLTEENNERN